MRVDGKQEGSFGQLVSKSKTQLAKAKASIKKTITKQDTFCVNDKYRSNLKRITINSIQKKESKKDSETVHQRVLADRKFFIDAAVVKTMKTKKSLIHRELVAEVIQLVGFPLEVQALNARIEWLISQSYMRRDDPEEKESKPSTVYHYIA